MKTLLLTSVLIFTLFACTTKKETTTKSEKLGNSSWQVTMLGTTTPISIQTITITDNTVKGKAACNGFGGKIKLSDSNLITFSDIFATKMGCPNLSEESSFLEKLRKTTNYKLVKEELSFYAENNKLLVTLKKVQL